MSNNRGGPMLLSRKEMGDRGESRPGSGGGRGRGRGGRGGAGGGGTGRGGAGGGSARNDVSEGMGRMQIGGSGESSRGGRGGFRGGAPRGGGWQEGGRGGRGGGAPRGGGGHRGGFSTGSDRPASDYLAPTAEQQMEQYAAGSQPATDDATLPQQLGKADRSKFEKVKLVSNIWELIVENRLVYRYDVNVMLVRADPERPRIDLTRRAGDDAARVERHELVRLALRRGLEMYRLLSERGAAVHDDAALLFTNECICEQLKETGQLHIPLDELSERARQLVHSATTSADVNEIVIEVRACAEGTHSFNMADVHQAVTTNLTQVDKGIKQFYELITNQDALVNGQHTLYGNGKLFNHNKRGDDLGFGHERKAGMSKGIKFVEGSGGPSRAVAALVLDYKVGTFFKATGLLSSVCELNGWRSASHANWTEETRRKTAEYVKGLRLIYDKQSFVASGLSMQPLRDIEYKTVDGKMEKLITRFANLDEKIMFDSFPAVRRRVNFPGGFRDMHYPIELLQVAPNQRVPLDKQIAEPARPMRIDDRWRQIMSSLDELNLNGVNGNRYNEFMGRFGVSVSSQPMRVEGFRRPMPGVSYGRENAMVDSNMGDWRTGKTYAKAGQIGFWLVLFDDQRDEKIARTFVNVMMHHAASKGIKIEKSEVHQCKRDSRFSALKQFFEMAKKNQDSTKKLYFITYIDNEKVEGSHSALKLYERMFCVLSQQVNTARAMNVEKQGRTRDNIIAKWNEKIFGHNYVVKPEACANSVWMNGDVLIIGYDVCHPRPQTAAEKAAGIHPEIPSVVGFSFNGAEGDTSKFVGDYHFQEPKMEQVADSVLNARIKWMLSRFQKINKKLPKKIVIVRDGVSEGQYRMVKEEEVAAVREGIEEYGNTKGVHGLRIPIALIVVTKRHDLRLLAESGGRVDAPKPLTTVDSHVVRANQTEFVMQTHRAIQGTPKASCYNLLVNELEMSMDEVQALMAALTFCHEISNGPTSIPEPVYQADEWAKRGKNNFVTLKKLSFRIPRKAENGKPLDECEIDYETLTNKLSYWNTAMEGTRANA